MERIHGTGASDGIAMGRVVLWHGCQANIEKYTIKDVPKEFERLQKAQDDAVDVLNEIYLKSLKRVGKKDSMIFQIHMMMIQDEDYSQAIRNRIKENKVNAEYAVWETGQEFAARFAKMDSEYMRGRKTDIIDISDRLVKCLNPEYGSGKIAVNEPSILAADDLTPSETMQLDKSKIIAIVMRKGSRTSHSAILSRTMGIPSVVGLGDGFDNVKDGMIAVVNGTAGEVILEPDEAEQGKCQQALEASRRKQQELKSFLGAQIKTKSGRIVAVNANIGHPADVETALKNGADGIGLFRSEFLYMGRDSLPTEDEQFEAYKSVLEKMGNKPVIVRTFDIGADKQIPYLHLPKEANPALGYRAIRICLDRKDLFRAQLRALVRASAFGNLKIMFPMIISVEEVREAKQMLQETKSELESEKISFAHDIKVGIMIETPSSVVLSDELAKECDFFSIGTNDLTQYTLAADRLNDKIAKIYDQSNPAVLKMIELTAKNAHKAGISVGICGESAADPKLAEFYLKTGIDELSVAPPSVLGLKKTLKQACEKSAAV